MNDTAKIVLIQDGVFDTARVLLYFCYPEYKSVLAGREEGVRMGVYLPDCTVAEVRCQVGHNNSMKGTTV